MLRSVPDGQIVVLDGDCFLPATPVQPGHFPSSGQVWRRVEKLLLMLAGVGGCAPSCFVLSALPALQKW